MNRLLLCPQDIYSKPPDSKILLAALSEIQLIASPLTHQSGFLCGDRFLQLITFLGCMPYVELEEPEQLEKEFCFVRLPEATDQPRLRTGSNTLRPRCPHCKAAILDWQAIASAWPEAGACPKCHVELSAKDLRWGENAGLGRVFIEIYGIHPSEAVPSDELLNRLQDTCQFRWKWFYLQ